MSQSNLYSANTKRYLRFAAVLSGVFSLGVLVFNFRRFGLDWGVESLIFTLGHLVLSAVGGATTYGLLNAPHQKKLIKANNQLQESPKAVVSSNPSWHRPLGVLLMLSVLLGNPFNFMSGFIFYFRKIQAYQYFLLFAVLVDLTLVAVSLINLAKPQVNPHFYLGMSLLLINLMLHSLLLLAPNWIDSLKGRMIIVPILAMGVLSWSGNLLSFAAAYLLAKSRQQDKRRSLLANLARHEVAMFGLYIITVILALAITSYLTFDYSYAVENNYSAILQTPSWLYPLGTDNFGRDVFSRLIFGGRISILVGLLATLGPLFIGGFLGALAGYYSQRIDQTIMRVLDILYAIPGILLAITIVTAFGTSTQNLILALSIGGIPGYARTMRASVLQVKQMEYIEAARALGVSDAKIILKHVIPNASAPMIIRSSLTVATAVISTSSLSYLGLGVESHIPEWGNILRIGSDYLETHPYLAIYPGLAIIALVLSFNFLGDGLRDALDPKMK